MDTDHPLNRSTEILGVIGAGCLAYSAGYTRAYVVENDIPITVKQELLPLGGIPTAIGLLGFVGLGLLALYVGSWAVRTR